MPLLEELPCSLNGRQRGGPPVTLPMRKGFRRIPLDAQSPLAPADRPHFDSAR